jgi:hypothetical protein
MKKNYATSTSFFNLVKMPLMLAFMLLMLAFAQVAYSQETVSTVPVWDGNQKVNICVGGTVSVSVANSTSGHNYRLRSTDPAYTYTEIVTSTGGTLTFTLLTFNATDAGILFNVRDISDPSGYEVPDDNFEVIVVADPIAPTMIKNPNVASVCEGEEVDATDVSAGSGGAGCSDSKWYRTETNNTTWSSWQSYTPGNNISTVGKTGVEVKAERSPSSENGCYAENIYAWDVIVTAPPAGSASQSFCSINNPKVSDISVTGTSVIWYDASTGGNVVAGTTALVNGTTYYATQTLNSCESYYRLAVTVTVADPDAPTGSASQSFCAINLPLVSDISVTGTGIIWYNAATNGTVVPPSTSLVTGTTYYASQTVAGCESDTRLAVTVTVADPAAPIGDANQTFCAYNNPLVSNISVTGTNIIWYNDATAGNVVTGTTSLVDGTTYYASQTVDGCESDTRLAVTVAVDDDPPTGTANQTFCAIDIPDLFLIFQLPGLV